MGEGGAVRAGGKEGEVKEGEVKESEVREVEVKKGEDCAIEWAEAEELVLGEAHLQALGQFPLGHMTKHSQIITTYINALHNGKWKALSQRSS